MAKRVFKILKGDVWFHIFSITAIALIVISFFIPPVAVIDSSIFVATGEIFAFAALNEVRRAIDRGYDTTINHGQTSITISNDEEENDDAGETTE